MTEWSSRIVSYNINVTGVLYNTTCLHLFPQELEEENEHMNEDLKRLTGDYKRLQDEFNSLKKQLSTPAPPAVVRLHSL